jgi:hypothetical protein
LARRKPLAHLFFLKRRDIDPVSETIMKVLEAPLASLSQSSRRAR